MGVKEAAIKVLSQVGRPLSAQEITEQILSQGLWRTEGKTPAATVAAALYTDMKQQGDQSPFVRVAPQTFGLRGPGTKPPQAATAAAATAGSTCAARWSWAISCASAWQYRRRSGNPKADCRHRSCNRSGQPAHPRAGADHHHKRL